MRFAGKTAIVTGAAGEIGRATAMRLAREGARVLTVDINEDAAEHTARLVRDGRGHARSCRADVSDPSDTEAYVAAGLELGEGRLNYLFNNAGIEGVVRPLEDLPVEVLDKVYAVNVRGVFLGMKFTLPHLSAGDVIVNTASTGALRGSPGMAAYTASKHAVLGLTRTASLEVAARGVRVVALAPGAVEGRMMTSISSQTRAFNRQDVEADDRASAPTGRYATPEEVAAVAAFLFSSDASFVSGSPVIVDGARNA